MFGIGMQELAIIFVVALLIFGPKRLPELARTLGKGLAEFRRASSDLRQSFDLETRAAPPPPPPPRPEPRSSAGEGEDPREQRDPPGRPAQAVDAVAEADSVRAEPEAADGSSEGAAADRADPGSAEPESAGEGQAERNAARESGERESGEKVPTRERGPEGSGG